jgi:hypothetical protein
MHPDLRFWTAIIVAGICAFSVVRGLSILNFSLDLANIASLENRAETIHTWTAVPAIASAALQTELKQKLNSSDLNDANSRREALATLLSIKPLSSTDWLILSGIQLTTDQPLEQVLATLMLSTITGPNEGYVMADRGTFSVSLWEYLSPDLKRHSVMDLAAGETNDTGKLRAVLSVKSETVRNELRTAILSTGLSPEEVERRLGF